LTEQTRNYPIALNLQRLKCVVVGAGRVGERKALGLVKAGATPLVVGLRAAPGVRELARSGKVRLLETEYRPDLLQGAALVFAATDDPALNARVAADARSVGALVNVWGFGPAPVRPWPDDVELETARARTGFRYLELAGNRLRGDIPTGPRQVLQNDLITPLAGRCIDAQTVAIGFQLEGNSKTVLEYRGPLLGEFSLPTASLWGERIGNLAELAAYVDDDEVAKAAESRETNGFYRVWGRTGLTSQVVCIFRHEGWEFRINSMSGRAYNVPQVGVCDPYRSLNIGVTSPAGELYHLPGLSSGCPLPG